MSEPKRCWLLELDVEPYDHVWEMQHRLVEARRAGRIPDVFLLLEHEPVITLGRRGHESNILAAPARLEELGVIVRKVERGGDVTYHGPGQIVGYPILRIHDHNLGASDYMHALEEVLIRVVGDLGITAYRRDGLVGVWTEGGKVAALGARIQLGVSFHGFALNVDPIMEHWRLIVPCGLTEPVTSMRQLLGRRVEVAEVRARVRARFEEVFGVALQPVTWGEIEPLVG
ncbi:MAG: lipoyl(octanoyl) transferase LipB [Chloroflexi bacterium]|nr:lipoyl(octanoyl) transferase LipB [Chloroflexota bacterium]